MSDLCMRNGRLVTEAGLLSAHLYVRNGRIAAISSEPGMASGEVVDAGGGLVFPGAIDAHVHFNDPGRTEAEDFFTGFSAAAAGGVTTVLEMPQTVPVVADESSFSSKKAGIGRRSVVDYGLYLVLTPDNIPRVEEMCSLKPMGFKCFLSHSDDIGMLDDGMLYEGMLGIQRAGSRLVVHAETGSLIDVLTARLRSEGRGDPLAHAESRPPFVEVNAVARTVSLAEETGASVHIAHCSTPGGVGIVSRARAAGVPVTVETTPHYLALTSETLRDRGPYAKCNPPLRTRDEVEALWSRVAAGEVDIVASDHAPYTFADKDAGLDSIWSAPAGVTSIQTMVPVVLSEGRRRGLGWTRLAELVAAQPARVFGLYPAKGTLRVVSDADMFIFEPDAGWTVECGGLMYRQPWTPFEGMKVQGRIRRTLVRGRTVYLDSGEGGEITVSPGYGRFVFPGFSVDDRDG
ncbi:MAG: allantoinase AllB [Bacillota bacterium]